MQSDRGPKGKEKVHAINDASQQTSLIDDIFAALDREEGKFKFKVVEYSNKPLHSDKLTLDELEKTLYEKIISIRRTHIDVVKGFHSARLSKSSNSNFSFWLRQVEENFKSYNDDKAETRNHEKALLFNYLRLFDAYLLAATKIIKVYRDEIGDTSKFEALHNSIKKIGVSTERAVTKSIDLLSNSTDKTSHIQENVLRIIEEQKGALIDLLVENIPEKAFTSSGFGGTHEQITGKMLDQAKDWVALDQPSIPVCTVIPGNEFPGGNNEKHKLHGKQVVIVDEPCTQLTDEQKTLISNRKNEDWYKKLKPFQQAMVEEYQERILQCDREIPSQLRSVIPLGKNTYRQRVYVGTKDQYEELNSYYHTGTPAFLNDNVTLEYAGNVTRENLAQQKLNSNTDAIVMIALNSSYGDAVIGAYEKILGHSYRADDSKIIQLTSKAAENNPSTYYSKICLNGFRSIEPNDYSGINAVVENIILSNIKKLENIIALDQTTLTTLIKDHSVRCNEKNESGQDKFTEVRLEAELNSIQQLTNRNASLKQNIATLQALLIRLNNILETKTILDPDVIGTDIIYTLTQIASLSNKLAYGQNARTDNAICKTNPLQTVSVWFGCASGENRTGYAYFNNICDTITDYCGYDKKKREDDETIKQLRQLISKTDQVKIMSGFQGSTLATECIRSKSKGSAKRNDPQDLIHKVADMKAVVALDAEFNKAIKDLEAELQRAEKNKKDSTIQAGIPYAANLLNYAKQQRTKLFTTDGMTRSERKLFTASLNATTNWLSDPSRKNAENIQALLREDIMPTRPMTELSNVSESKGASPSNQPSNQETARFFQPSAPIRHPIFHNKTKRSWKLVACACLLGLVAATTIAFSITAAVATFGIATPLSALGVAVGITIAAHAAAIAGVAIGAGVLATSAYFIKNGLKEDDNVAKNLHEMQNLTPKPSRICC